MENYLNLVKKILQHGNIRTDRTNTGTISLFGEQLEFDLAKGFPLDASRQVFMRGNLEELFWMLRGSTDNQELVDKNVNIWSAWAVRQEHLEYTQQERMAMFHEKCLVTAKGNKADGQAIYETIVADNIDMDTMLDLREIPRLKPNPYNVKIGALGPVYGRQWCDWPDPANDVEIVFSVDERFKIAEDMLAAGVAEKFTQAGLDDVKEDYAGYMEDTASSNFAEPDFHRRLDRYGIPASTTKYATINQIARLIDDLKARPNSRRHIISAWNVAQLPDESMSPQQNVVHGKMALAPCHTLFQYYVEDRSVQDMIPELPEDVQREFKWFIRDIGAVHLGKTIKNTGTTCNQYYWESMFNFEKRQQIEAFFKEHGVKTKKLSCKLYSRSCDLLVGGAFNISAYAAQTMMVAQCVDMVPGNFIITFGDVHIYKNQILPNAAGDSVFTQLAREPLPMPTLWINPEVKNIFDFKYEDFKLVGYNPHAPIRYPVAV